MRAARHKARPDQRKRAREAPAPAPKAVTEAPGRRILQAVLLGASCALVYLSSVRPVLTWDTIPTRLVPFSLLREGNVNLNEFEWLQRLDRMPYFLRRTSRGDLLSAYPLVTSLIATPVAAPIELWLRWRHIDVADERFRLAAMVSERIAAAAIAAVSVSLVFFALCRLTSRRVAFVLAVGYGLGTNTWATSSQALWQHGTAELCLAGLSLSLVADDTRRNAIIASLFAGLGVLARPTMAIFALMAAVFVWRERRQHVLAFLALPLAGTAAMFAYNVRTLGHLFGGYRAIEFSAPRPERLAGLLVSPSRGLFLYSPLTLLAVPGVARWRRERGWVRYALIAVGGYLLLYASFKGWPGGYTYGPRFLVDVLPVLVLAVVPAAEWLDRRRWGCVLLAALVLVGVAIQAIGAYCDDDSWNRGPAPLRGHSERLWDWTDLQIVRAARGGWRGTELAPILWQAYADPRPVQLEPMTVTDLAGTVEVEDPVPLRFQAGTLGSVLVEVRNGGSVMWPAFSDYGYLQCSLVYVWRRDGRALDDLVGAVPLPRNLGPGESARVAARIEVPTTPGDYELELLLVQVLDENKARSGNAARRVPVQVVRRS